MSRRRRRAALAGRADGGEEHAADDEVEVGARRDDRGVVAAELEQRAAEAGRDARRQLLAHLRRARGRDERDPRIVGELHGAVGAADHELREARRARRRTARAARSSSDMQASAVSGVRSEGFQITGSPQTSASAAFQLQTATGKLKALITATGPERVPRLGQPVAGALGRDRAAVELAREPHREVADVDHLLHLAEPLLGDLADLERHERAERLLLAAQLLAEEAHELAAVRPGQIAPGREGLRGARDRRVGRGGIRARRRARSPRR